MSLEMDIAAQKAQSAAWKPRLDAFLSVFAMASAFRTQRALVVIQTQDSGRGVRLGMKVAVQQASLLPGPRSDAFLSTSGTALASCMKHAPAGANRSLSH